MQHDNKKNNVRSSLSFVNYIVDYVELKNNIKFDSDEVEVDFDIIPEFDIDKENAEMMVGLFVEVFKDPEENNYPFEMTLKIIGFFRMNTNDDLIEKYKANAIAIMYPYIRSLVTTYTANANISPLILPTINVNKLLENSKKK